MQTSNIKLDEIKELSLYINKVNKNIEKIDSELNNSLHNTYRKRKMSKDIAIINPNNLSFQKEKKFTKFFRDKKCSFDKFCLDDNNNDNNKNSFDNLCDALDSSHNNKFNQYLTEGNNLSNGNKQRNNSNASNKNNSQKNQENESSNKDKNLDKRNKENINKNADAKKDNQKNKNHILTFSLDNIIENCCNSPTKNMVPSIKLNDSSLNNGINNKSYAVSITTQNENINTNNNSCNVIRDYHEKTAYKTNSLNRNFKTKRDNVNKNSLLTKISSKNTRNEKSNLTNSNKSKNNNNENDTIISINNNNNINQSSNIKNHIKNAFSFNININNNNINNTNNATNYSTIKEYSKNLKKYKTNSLINKTFKPNTKISNALNTSLTNKYNSNNNANINNNTNNISSYNQKTSSIPSTRYQKDEIIAKKLKIVTPGNKSTKYAKISSLTNNNVNTSLTHSLRTRKDISCTKTNANSIIVSPNTSQNFNQIPITNTCMNTCTNTASKLKNKFNFTSARNKTAGKNLMKNNQINPKNSSSKNTNNKGMAKVCISKMTKIYKPIKQNDINDLFTIIGDLNSLLYNRNNPQILLSDNKQPNINIINSNNFINNIIINENAKTEGNNDIDLDAFMKDKKAKVIQKKWREYYIKNYIISNYHISGKSEYIQNKKIKNNNDLFFLSKINFYNHLINYDKNFNELLLAVNKVNELFIKFNKNKKINLYKNIINKDFQTKNNILNNANDFSNIIKANLSIQKEINSKKNSNY